jgi:uncharacterized membrane protein YhhN
VRIPITVAGLVLLAGLLFFDRRQQWPGKLLTKLPLSSLFVLTASLQAGSQPVYHHLLLAGLSCCLVGDGCLVFPARGFFLAGLLAFLLGHCLYVAAFLSLSGLNIGLVAGLVLTGPVGYGLFRRLQPHADELRKPVAVYIVMISLMLSAAAAVYVDHRIPLPCRWLVLIGALSFYLSDLFVARQRFVLDSFANRLAGLPLYYGGQFCLALSAGFV